MATVAEIGAYAYSAGITSQSGLQAAIAIALAESSGNENAVGDKTLAGRPTSDGRHWGPSYGWWQIRSIQEDTGKGGDRDANALKGKAGNTAAMYHISKGGKDWQPWSTWPLKAAAFMPVAIPAATAVIRAKGVIAGVDTAVGAVSDAASSVVPDVLPEVGVAVKSTYHWVSDRNNWIRVGKVTIGIIILAGGVYAIANDTPAGKAVTGLVSPGTKLKVASKIVGKVAS
jgi:hypothetical protein